MPSKTTAESIQELRIDIAALSERVNGIIGDVDEADLRMIRERLAVLESLIAELKKREEETDRRRWQLQLGIAICVITFVANITINLLMFFVRK